MNASVGLKYWTFVKKPLFIKNLQWYSISIQKAWTNLVYHPELTLSQKI